MGSDAEGEINNHMLIGRTKAEEKHLTERPKSPKKKNSVRYPFNFVEENYKKKCLEENFQTKNTNRNKRK